MGWFVWLGIGFVCIWLIGWWFYSGIIIVGEIDEYGCGFGGCGFWKFFGMFVVGLSSNGF